jgi:hypothetical protein
MGFQRRSALAVAIGFVLLGVSLVAQSGASYKARLSPLPADARTRPDLAGVGTVTGTVAGSKLTVSGTFEGLKSPATTAQLHSAVAAGVRGPVIGDLMISKATSGTVSGSIELTAPQVESLHKGGIYVQLQSEKAPDGVIWGWLIKQ